MDSDYAVLVCHEHFVKVCEDFAVALFSIGASVLNTRMCQIIASQNHILCRRCDWRTVLRRQNIVYREHEESRFRLSFYRKRYVNRHLVSVEVGVKCRACERVKLDRSSVDKNGLERLNGKSVQRRSTVEHYGVIFDDLFENIPDNGVHSLDRALRALYVMALARFDEFLHNERFEEFDRHFFG